MSDERSERLRKRRKRSERNTLARASSKQQPTESDSDGEESESPADSTDATATDPENEQTDSAAETSVKDEQVGTYMYLPAEQAKALKRRYNVLKAEYEFEFDGEFEKNRHFYPLVVQYGLEELDGLDASEIQRRLEEISHD